MISEDNVTLKTAVMMMKIHRNKCQFNTFTQKTDHLNCNNIALFDCILNEINAVSVSRRLLESIVNHARQCMS